MVEDKGRKVKKRTMEWRKLAEEAIVSSSASSFSNLEKMIKQVLPPPRLGDEIVKVVRELMVGDKGKKMKKRIMEWRKMDKEAIVSSLASSFSNLKKMIKSEKERVVTAIAMVAAICDGGCDERSMTKDDGD
ncbi:hypothetical protein ACSBR1_030086 [Camellia fascicularis]